MAAWQALAIAGDSTTTAQMSRRGTKSMLQAAAGGSSSGPKRSLTECMADALAESLGVDINGDSAQERFKIGGVRCRRDHADGREA